MGDVDVKKNLKGPPKKAPRVQGAGSIDSLPSGSFRVRVTVDGKRVTEIFPTKGEAEGFRRAIALERMKDVREAAAPAPLPVVETLAAWGETWMKRRASQGTVRWTKDERRRWTKHVQGSPLATMPLVDVRPRDVRAWLDGMMEKRGPNGKLLSRQTILHAFNLVRKALADAADDERVASNPAADVDVPKRAEKRGDDPWTHLTAEEVRAVERCEAIPERERLLFVVAIYTGLRAGELWALRWADVATEGAAAVTVRASHKNVPKNGLVQRVPLLPAARDAFVALRALAFGEGGKVDGEALVFPAAMGGQRHRNDDAGWSSRKVRSKPRVGLRERAGITRRVRFHDLRHTFASHLVMGTWTDAPLPLVEVRDLMRHGSIAMTERYARLAPGHLHARIARMPSARAAEAPSAPVEAPAPASSVPYAVPYAVPYDTARPASDAGAPSTAGTGPSGVTNVRDQLPPSELVTPSGRRAETAYFQGAPEGTRTPDPRLRRPLLYPTELRARDE